MSNPEHERLLSDVSAYYTERLVTHGDTPRGVDWNSEDGQFLRFEKLAQILPQEEAFSLNDVGCGYGALIDFLDKKYPNFDYRGNDISGEMVQSARRRYADRLKVQFSHASKPVEVADYGIASGIFNLRQGRGDKEWLEYILQTLDLLNATSRLGFSFNCLTTYSDADRIRPDLLYYADPCTLFDHCKRKYSRQVALLHDYGLYEFTILVRKNI